MIYVLFWYNCIEIPNAERDELPMIRYAIGLFSRDYT